MSRKIYLFIGCLGLLGILLSFCNNKGMRWKEIKSNGLEKPYSKAGIGTGYLFEEMIFTDSLNGYLNGNYTNDDVIGEKTEVNLSNKVDAILLHTKDKGANWEELIVAKGNVSQLAIVDSVFYSVVEIYDEDLKKKVTNIYTSNNYGKDWKGGYRFNGIVQKMSFWSESKGLVLMSEQGYHEQGLPYLTTDGGREWSKITLPKPKIKGDYEIDKKGILYYYSSDKTLVRYDLNNIYSYQEITLSGAVVYAYNFVIDNQDRLCFIIENDKKKIELHRVLEGDDNFQIIEFPFGSDNPIIKVNLYDDYVQALVSEEGILSKGVFFYETSNNGKNWIREKAPYSYIRNVAFYQNKLWFRTFPGRMVLRE